MLLTDTIHDPLYQKMVAAFRGETEPWRRVNLAMRDALLEYAIERSPHYRRTISRGTPFEDIPVLDKPTIRRHLEDLLADGVAPERRVLHRTSGSTGEPLTFYRDVAQAQVENVSAERFLRRLHGIPLEATMVVITTAGSSPWGPPPSGRRGPTPGPPTAHGVAVTELTEERLRREIPAWEQMAPYFLFGLSAAIDWIADRIEALDLPVPRPVAVVTTGDTLMDQALRRIQRVFACPVHSRYGSLELPWLAGTIPGTRRYVCNPFLGYVEIVDEDGRTVEPGGLGRVLFTDLNNMVMPLIRYDVGDLATDSREGFVGGFRLIEDVVGRTSDVLRFPSGRVLPASVLSHVLFVAHDFNSAIRFYQCLQTGPNELELRVVWAGGPDDGTRLQIAEAVRQITGPGTSVQVVDVRELERLPSGKVWLVRRAFEP